VAFEQWKVCISRETQTKEFSELLQDGGPIPLNEGTIKNTDPKAVYVPSSP